jgi:hypothetical protein
LTGRDGLIESFCCRDIAKTVNLQIPAKVSPSREIRDGISEPSAAAEGEQVLSPFRNRLPACKRLTLGCDGCVGR